MSSSPQIVALLGVAGSGKTIVARRLLHAGFYRVRFGDPARDMLTAGFGCTPHEIDGDQRNAPQPRFGGNSVQILMQTLSHEWGRGSIHSDIWVHEWKRRVGLFSGFVLSDDLQRPNEAAAVREAGGIIVRVTRPGYSPANVGAFHRQARISHDIELINEGPDKLALVTDRFFEELASGRATAA